MLLGRCSCGNTRVPVSVVYPNALGQLVKNKGFDSAEDMAQHEGVDPGYFMLDIHNKPNGEPCKVGLRGEAPEAIVYSDICEK